MLGTAPTRFENRADAGRQLAQRLANFAESGDTLILAIPRGGVPVAYEVATFLHAPLDVFLSQKLGVPGNEELAFGALAAGDGRFMDQRIVTRAGITPEQVETITAEACRKLEQRAHLFRKGREPLALDGKRVILVDDGIATGSSIYAAIHALKQMHPKSLIIAVPVAPRYTCDRLEREVDLLVTVYAPEDFQAVGQFYRDFRQTSDDEVIDLLGRAANPKQQADEIPISGTDASGECGS